MQKGCLPAKEASVEMRLLVRPMLGCPVVQGGSSEKAVITQFLWHLDIQICVYIDIYKLLSIDRNSYLVWEYLVP